MSPTIKVVRYHCARCAADISPRDVTHTDLGPYHMPPINRNVVGPVHVPTPHRVIRTATPCPQETR